MRLFVLFSAESNSAATGRATACAPPALKTDAATPNTQPPAPLAGYSPIGSMLAMPVAPTALSPPLPAPEMVQVGQRFSFTITLFGDGWQFLPHFVLAVGEMGHSGIGRGTFTIASITAKNRLLQQDEMLLAPGEDLVTVPTRLTRWSNSLLSTIDPSAHRLTLSFLTPIRLTHQGKLMKQPSFGVLFRRLLHRIDTLGTQFAQMERRPDSDIEPLHALADQVQLLNADVQ